VDGRIISELILEKGGVSSNLNLNGSQLDPTFVKTVINFRFQ
jgi:hypothetical protein